MCLIRVCENKVAVAAAACMGAQPHCSHSNLTFANVVQLMVLAKLSVDVAPELGRGSGTSLTRRQNPIVQALFGELYIWLDFGPYGCKCSVGQRTSTANEMAAFWATCQHFGPWPQVFISYILDNVWLQVSLAMFWTMYGSTVGYILDNVWLQVFLRCILHNGRLQVYIGNISDN